MKRCEFMLGGEELDDIKACQVMESSVSYCYPATLWREAALILVNGGYGSLPVIDSDENLVGIVNEHDLLKVLLDKKDENKTKIEDIMAENPTTVTEDTPIMDIINLLEEKHLTRVPVVKDSKMVGILARRDLLLCHLRATSEPPHAF